MDTKTQDALKLAIDYLESLGYSSLRDPVVEACKEALKEMALDRMAKNARELGLEYEQKPLNELEIQRLWHGQTFMEFARDLERAHGIGE